MNLNSLIKYFKIIFFLILFILPSKGFADFIWPALIIETRLFSILPITIGLLIEFLFFYKILNFSLKQAIIADFTVNTVSTLTGFILIPLSGIFWECIAGTFFLYFLFGQLLIL